MSATLSPDRILSELSALWVDLGKQADGEESTGVLRACTMTLLVVADESDDPARFGETIARLMPQHPSRAIVVRVTAAPGRPLESRVFSQCWTSFGQRRHICCEQVEIVSSQEALAELPSAILPLLIPDLPAILWCRSPRLFDLPGFSALAAMSTKLVIDSAAFADTTAVFGRLRAALDRGQAVGDLAWVRLTRWRETISRIFDNRGCLAGLPQIAEARVGYPGSGQPGASALYLAAWLMEGLARAGAHPRLTLYPAPDQQWHVEIAGPCLAASLTHAAGRCAELQVNDRISRVAFPDRDDDELLSEELSIPGHDPIFESTLAAIPSTY